LKVAVKYNLMKVTLKSNLNTFYSPVNDKTKQYIYICKNVLPVQFIPRVWIITEGI